jgi:serine/threonine-protein kinase
MVGTTLGKYRVEAQISEGGMGAIYRAVEVETGQVVALKVLRRVLATDRAFLQRFRREVRALQQVQHPNVIRIHDVGSEGDVHYYAMEHLPQSLADLLRAGRTELRRALQIASQVARGLEAVHAAGIVHRDVKPNNILLDPEGRAKVTDFGIARLGDATRMTQTGLIVGTPYYMAPEQVDDAEVDARADIYSLGVVLYEMVVGRPPFGGRTALEVLRQHRFSLPEPPKSRNPRLSSGLSHLILGMLEKAPAKRPPSMAQVADALEHIEGNLAEEAKRPGWRPPEPAASSTELAERYERSYARFVRWGKVVAALAAALLLAHITHSIVAPLLRGPAQHLADAQALEARDVGEGIVAYDRLARRYPGTPEGEKALARANALRAEEQKRAVAAQPRLSDSAVRARMAYLHYSRAEKVAEAGRLDHAREIYRRVREEYADTPWGPRADRRLKDIEAQLAKPERREPKPGPPEPKPTTRTNGQT